ncbi:MAG: REP element-mobilizing transposase RayT [Paraglaciecola sp.]|jgi:REP element-mobilizing transposase RayT
MCTVVFMSEHIDKSYNKSLLLYHFVCPVKYRRKVFSSDVLKIFKDDCLKKEGKFEIQFLETGIDVDHVYFLI